jgi:hypothetical protein
MSSKISKEITVSTDWGSLIASNNVDQTSLITMHTPLEGKEIYLLSNIFSQKECKTLIQSSEWHGFGSTDYNKKYRGNLRLIVIDPSFTSQVWQRMRPLIPSTIEEDGQIFEAVGLNDHWRLAKYFPGDQFSMHVDTEYRDSKIGHKSMFTVNIYMNEGFTGGDTSFLFDDNSTYDVTPQTGLCLLFRQPSAQLYRHEGKRLESGMKYLFRSDVMYRLVAAAKCK